MNSEVALYLSILAMDSHNRGYDPGIGGLSASIGTEFGGATVVATSDTDANSAEVQAGLQAITDRVSPDAAGERLTTNPLSSYASHPGQET